MLYPDATIQSQYAASPTITALVEGFNHWIDPRSEIELFFDKIFNPRTAEGIGLDIWARIVGVERNIYVEDLSENFGFFITGGSPVPDTYTVPAAVQSLTGYGWSAGEAYNYVDFERKVFVQNVAAVDMGTLAWAAFEQDTVPGRFRSLGLRGIIQAPPANSVPVNAINPLYGSVSISSGTSSTNCFYAASTGNVFVIDPAYSDATAFTAAVSGKLLYFELAEPVETDISAYISGTPSLSVESNTALTFANANGNDYCIPVPSTITYTAGGESVTDDTVAYTKSVGTVQGAVSIESIGGKTVVWNQLMPAHTSGSTTQNDLTITWGTDGSLSVSGTASALTDVVLVAASTLSAQSGHKVFFSAPAGGSADTYMVYNTYLGVKLYDTTIVSFGASGWASGNWTFRVISGAAVNIKFTPVVCDLTLMFGAGNEPATVAEFQAMFPSIDPAYNAGELISAGVTGVSYTKRPVMAQEWQPWDQGVFYSPDTVQRGSYRIDDTAFRKFIFWKALANISTADCYTLNRLLTKLFDNPVIVTETGVMQIRMTTTKPLADWQKAVLIQYGMFGKPAGVGYEFWTIVTPVLGFVRDGENYMPLGQAPFFSGVMNSDFGGN